MERVTLPGLPEKRAADYQLDGFDPPRFARVKYTPQESKPDRAQIECQAFEVDAAGNFVAIPNGPKAGEPSRTSGTIHVISISGVGDTHTLQPGWVRVVGDYSPTPNEAQSGLPEGAQILEALPASGGIGDHVYVAPTLYRWDVGMVESTMRAKAEELAGLIRNSTAIANFEL